MKKIFFYSLIILGLASCAKQGGITMEFTTDKDAAAPGETINLQLIADYSSRMTYAKIGAEIYYGGTQVDAVTLFESSDKSEIGKSFNKTISYTVGADYDGVAWQSGDGINFYAEVEKTRGTDQLAYRFENAPVNIVP